MPMFAEVGPLTMDEDVFSQAQSFISKPEASRRFYVHINSSNIQQIKDIGMPIK